MSSHKTAGGQFGAKRGLYDGCLKCSQPKAVRRCRFTASVLWAAVALNQNSIHVTFSQSHNVSFEVFRRS